MSSDLVSLTYIGGPTLLIECAGLRLLTDPTFDEPGREYPGPVVLHKLTGPAMPISELGPIDAVLLSHDHHIDNLDQAGRASLTNPKSVITTVEGSKRLGDNSVGLEPGQHCAIHSQGGELTVTAMPAQHGPAGKDRGPVIGFTIARSDAGSGPLIYVSGDTVLFPALTEELTRLPSVRIAVLFMGAARVPVVDGHLTFTAEEAVQIAQAHPDMVIIPVHFEGWKHFTEGQAEIQATFERAGLANRLLFLARGQRTPVNLRS